MHLFLFILGGGLSSGWNLFLNLCQKLLNADCQGLKLEFLDDQGDGALPLPTLEVENALAGLAERIGRYMVNWTEIDVNGVMLEVYQYFIPL